MRAPPRGNSRRLLLPAALLLRRRSALAAGGPPRRRTLQEKLDATPGQARATCARARASLAATIAEQNRGDRLDDRRSLGPAPATGRGRGRTRRPSRTNSTRATAKLEADKHRLALVRARLQRALDVLRERLVAIYESGSPDMLNVVLDSASWSEVNARADYLSQIQEYDDSVAGRVKALRDEARAAVKRMTAVRLPDQGRARRDRRQGARSRRGPRRSRGALRRTEGGPGRAPRSARIARVARRSAEQQPRRRSPNRSPADRRPGAGDRHPGAADPGRERRLHLRKPGQRPSAGARPRSQAAIEAANSIATTPYIWGGGHGSFESSGYDCSGAVSFALHGGGFLSSPLDSTGLETWGEPGPGQWITVYANAGHAWMIIAGLAFDTVGGPGPRWHSSPVDSPEGFVARHPPGY